jgi:hypothetical protein
MNPHHPHTPDPADEQLEARLARLTTWQGDTGEPLRRALAAHDAAASPVLRKINLFKPLSRRHTAAAAILLAAAGLVITAALVPPGSETAAVSTLHSEDQVATEIRSLIDRVRWLQASRKYEEALQTTDQILALKPMHPTGLLLRDVLRDVKEYAGLPSIASTNNHSYDLLAIEELTNGREPPPMSKANGVTSQDLAAYPVDWPPTHRVPDYLANDTNQNPRISGNEITQDQPAPARQIIRRAQMDVVAPDVTLAFRALQDLIKPELGEFIQETTLSGSGSALAGRVILRVRPDRLQGAMRAVRDLGELASEQTGGDDVTDRLADLDAQIRNEQRVEREMLDLFDLRKDAPLKEILELREQLARVRATIERLQAQKAQSERLVALATLTVIVRPPPDQAVAPPPVDETPSFGTRLTGELSRAWDRATTNLAASVGWIVEAAVGKLPLWLTLAALGLIAWRIIKKKK